MSEFDGIDRSASPSRLAGIGAVPLSIETLRAGFARMLAQRDECPFWGDGDGISILYRYRNEIFELRALGVAGDELGHALASRSGLTHAGAVSFVEWLEAWELRASSREIVAIIARMLSRPPPPAAAITAQLQREAVRRPQPPRRASPPVPPWARERGRKRHAPR